MDELKQFIEDNREGFENENLPEYHEDRFFSKLQNEHRREIRTYNYRRFSYYFAAASVVLLLFLTPMLYFNMVYNKRSLDVADYIGILKERSVEITAMAGKLNSSDKDMVLNTLDQLTFEAVPFDSQLSDDIRNGERHDMIKSYYAPKIEGVDKLKQYVTQLNKNIMKTL